MKTDRMSFLLSESTTVASKWRLLEQEKWRMAILRLHLKCSNRICHRKYHWMSSRAASHRHCLTQPSFHQMYFDDDDDYEMVNPFVIHNLIVPGVDQNRLSDCSICNIYWITKYKLDFNFLLKTFFFSVKNTK